jgi:hypothetical protein
MGVPKNIELITHSSQPPPNGAEHDLDAIGDLCDAWVGAGSAFEQGPDNEYRRVYVERPEPITPEHNPALVDEILDWRGQPIRCVTANDRSPNPLASPDSRAAREPFRFALSCLPRLMKDLPPEHLVYPPTSPYGRTYRPGSLQPVGIKLTSLLQVRKTVRTAYLELPEGERHYPPGALVLSGAHQDRFLALFDAVLTPPTQQSHKPAPHTPEGTEPVTTHAPVPFRAPVLPTVTPQDQGRNIHDAVFTASVRIGPYVCTLLGGVLTGVAIQGNNDGELTPAKTYLCLAIAGVCGLTAVAAYFADKNKKK